MLSFPSFIYPKNIYSFGKRLKIHFPGCVKQSIAANPAHFIDYNAIYVITYLVTYLFTYLSMFTDNFK